MKAAAVEVGEEGVLDIIEDAGNWVVLGAEALQNHPLWGLYADKVHPCPVVLSKRLYFALTLRAHGIEVENNRATFSAHLLVEPVCKGNGARDGLAVPRQAHPDIVGANVLRTQPPCEDPGDMGLARAYRPNHGQHKWPDAFGAIAHAFNSSAKRIGVTKALFRHPWRQTATRRNAG